MVAFQQTVVLTLQSHRGSERIYLHPHDRETCGPLRLREVCAFPRPPEEEEAAEEEEEARERERDRWGRAARPRGGLLSSSPSLKKSLANALHCKARCSSPTLRRVGSANVESPKAGEATPAPAWNCAGTCSCPDS